MNEAAQLLPDEYEKALAAFLKGDALARSLLFDEAEQMYQQSWKLGRLLEQNLEREHQAAVASALHETESVHLELARKRAIMEEQRRLADSEKTESRMQTPPVRHLVPAEPKPKQKEKPQLTFYTVRRGESLPQIAARVEVYADSQLWPLLYRANRDQVSDPRRIWPGQPLRIPRNVTAEELAEARRFATKSAYF